MNGFGIRRLVFVLVEQARRLIQPLWFVHSSRGDGHHAYAGDGLDFGGAPRQIGLGRLSQGQEQDDEQDRRRGRTAASRRGRRWRRGWRP